MTWLITWLKRNGIKQGIRIELMRHALRGDARKWGLSIAQQKDYMRQSSAELFSPLKGGIQGGALRLIEEEACMLRLREMCV